MWLKKYRYKKRGCLVTTNNTYNPKTGQYEKICQYRFCGMPFPTYVHNQKYCCPECFRLEEKLKKQEKRQCSKSSEQEKPC
jgi:hypothetical protein